MLHPEIEISTCNENLSSLPAKSTSIDVLEVHQHPRTDVRWLENQNHEDLLSHFGVSSAR